VVSFEGLHDFTPSSKEPFFTRLGVGRAGVELIFICGGAALAVMATASPAENNIFLTM
jgi:hypothetical protein